MLKLMKHEFRATGRTMVPLCLLTLIAAVGGNLSVRQLTAVDNGFLNALGVLLLAGFGIAIAAVCIMSVVVMIRRFYGSLLQDEGYVMMTLPVSVHQHIWAKLLVSTVWFAVTAATVALAMLLLAMDVELVHEVFGFFGPLLRDLLELDSFMVANGTLLVLEVAVLLVLACFSICLEFYSALAIGHSFANHKMLLSVVFFFALNAIVSMVSSGALEALHFTPFPELVEELLSRSGGAMRMTHLMLLGIIVMALARGAVYYFLTWYPLAKRLNLE